MGTNVEGRLIVRGVDMKENLGDLYRMRVTSDGRVVMWKRGERVPPEARTDICGICWRDNGVAKPLVVNKVEFPGKLGKIERDRKSVV